MYRARIAVVASLLALLPLAAASAHTVGGLTWGQEVNDSLLSSSDLSARLAGVYGYDVNYAGQRTGGFALALYSDSLSPAVVGGFVGGLAGQEFRRSGLLMAINLWAGFGGLTAGRGVPADGSFAVYAEATAEIGFTGIPGMVVTGYAGLQAMSAVSSGEAFFSRAMYAPVVGVRLAWGS